MNTYPMYPRHCPAGSQFVLPGQARRASTACARSKFLAYRCAMTLVVGTWALFATGAQAQGNSCDLLKTVLTERIDPSIKGYSMETVPAKTPVAQGGKVIGTCESGASKIVYFRFGAPEPSTGTAAGADNGPASAAPGATIAAPTQATPPPPAPSTPAPTSAVKVAVEVTVAAAPKAPPPTAQVAAPGNSSATPSSPAKQTPEKSAASAAPQAQATSTAAPATSFAPPFAAVVQSGADSMAAPDPAQPADFLAQDSMAKKWRWVLALVVVAIAGGLWAWRSHHNAYDASGLPRGPRL